MNIEIGRVSFAKQAKLSIVALPAYLCIVYFSFRLMQKAAKVTNPDRWWGMIIKAMTGMTTTITYSVYSGEPLRTLLNSAKSQTPLKDLIDTFTDTSCEHYGPEELERAINSNGKLGILCVDRNDPQVAVSSSGTDNSTVHQYFCTALPINTIQDIANGRLDPEKVLKDSANI